MTPKDLLHSAVLDVDASRRAAEKAWAAWKAAPGEQTMLDALSADRKLKDARAVRNERIGWIHGT